jgi:tetratricopeptide (TPR) repeat protein
MKGEILQAIALLEESLEAFRDVGDQWGIAYSLNDLGLMLHLRGETGEAERQVKQSRAMLRQLGDRRGAAFAAYNLGLIETRRDDHARAQGYYRESLALREAGHDQWGIGASLVQLAAATRALGDREEARHLYLAALRIAWESSVRPVVLETLVGLATLLIEDGKESEADPILAPVAVHPSTPGQLRQRILQVRPGIGEWPGSPARAGVREPWAERAVDDLVRRMLDEVSGPVPAGIP